MKKIIFSALLYLIAFLPLSAQLFDCSTLYNAMDIYNSATNNKNLEEWARKLYSQPWHKDDGSIFLQFVFPATDSLNMARVAVICEYWLDNKKNDLFLTKKFDFENEKVPALKGIAGLGEVSKDNSFKAGFTGIYTHLYSYINLMIELKDNRLRVTASMDCYKVGYTGENAKSDFFRSIHDMPIVNVPPFTKEKPKDFYLSAYINTHSRSLNKISELMKFISQKYNEIDQRNAAEEARQNDDW